MEKTASWEIKNESCFPYHNTLIRAILPTYLYELIPPILWTNTSNQNLGCYRAFYCRADLFRHSFLPFSINKCSKLDPDIRTLDSQAMFHKKLLASTRPSEKSIYNIYDPQGFKLISRLRLGFSHLCRHKPQFNFAGTVNPLCSSAFETESTDHLSLHRQNYVSSCTALNNELISSINCEIVS